MRDTLLADCVTVQTLPIDGKYMAESVEEGDDLTTGNAGQRVVEG